MDVLSPVSDEEREDGEIVDDDLEDISDYSIPSCGKSDYSDGIIRAISLSSISGSEGGGGGLGEREYCERKVLLTTLAIGHLDGHGVRATTRKRRSRDYLAAAADDPDGRSQSDTKKKQRLRDVPKHQRPKQQRRKSFSRSASLSSSSDSSSGGGHVIDRRTLRQLNKAVRIETRSSCEPDVQHRSLKDRLKRMIQPDDFHDEDIAQRSHSTNAFDDTFDKELEELRLQALKSAMLKKHMERKKRKALENNQNFESTTTNLVESNIDKENKNIPNCIGNNDNEIIAKLEKLDEGEDIGVEDDLDIMRAMLLASMSKKITSEQPSLTLNPIQNKTALTLSTSSSPIPPEFQDKKKMHKSNFSLPLVKPLIIRVNHDSETDTTDDENESHPPRKTPLKIESSIEEFLRTEREKFEAKLVENDRNSSRESTENALDKSFLKLLPQSQQQEYKLLKQKLLQAKKASKTTAKKTEEQISKENQPGTDKQRRDKRSQPKGKYKELAPLVQKIRAELAVQRRQETHEKQLMAQLEAVRGEIQVHRRRHANLVGQLRKARGIIDLRWQTLEKAKIQQAKKSQESTTSAQLVAQVPTKKADLLLKTTAIIKPHAKPNVQIRSAIVDSKSAIVPVATIPPPTSQLIKEVETIPVNNADASINKDENGQDVEKQAATEITESLTYVSPLDRRATNVSSNPLQMLCPYELFGVCKDASCTFNHCP